jgi:hypothetical protein
MNERLRSLMIESGTHLYISRECQDRIEYIANLIVKECAQVCMSQADRRNILKRFGMPVEDPVKYPGPELKNSVESQYDRPLSLPK